MTRKECDNNTWWNAGSGERRPRRSPHGNGMRRASVPAVFFVAVCAADAPAGSVRLWPSAVVVADSIRLDDLCELTGFDAASEQMIAGVVVAEAPAAGGSRLIHIDMIRSALTAGGANMAQLTLRGATQCEVSRPSQIAPTRPMSGRSDAAPRRGSSGLAGSSHRRSTMSGLGVPGASATNRPTTLRVAVIEYFGQELSRYGGTADVTFDRTSEQILDLSGPMYEFRVRRRDSAPLGLISLEVDVVAEGRTVQTVPLVVQVTMTARVVVARRTINQGATIRSDDVELVPLSFDRLDDLGLESVAQAVGQRAKRIIPAGSLIELDLLEPVPLVLRGQLVTLTSVSGAIRVVTTAKAAADGLFGEVIKVRTIDDERAELDAVVTGPGQAQIGGDSSAHRMAAIADRSNP